ncbi:MAG TPA: SGNH/GDSL hydrolase family protein [Thermoanaerobaculia bacterium]|jgi:lysophospholipase L1-like esterase
MHRLKVLAGALTLALLLVAGAAFAVDTGTADFSRYVAFGDSLTAGFSSGSLVRTYQVNSYPALIYRQATGQSTGFEQPLISEPGIPPVLVLRSLSPLSITPSQGQGQPINLNLPRPYNNIAVPGADVHDLLATTQGGLHDVVLRRQGFTQLQQGLSLQPTFVTLWIGNNDALAAATSGIVNDQTLTPEAQFAAEYRMVTAAIASTGAKMAIANIPDVTSIPFVTTISRFIVNPQTNQPVLGPTGQPIPLIGPNGPLQAGDFVLLSATAELALGRGIPAQLGGSGQPLSDSVVLSANEAATIRARVQAFNNIIASEANARGAAFVDFNAALSDVNAHGYNVGGITYTTAFLTGGFVSYDGVHPTAFGYAYIANLFIDAINEKFGGEIPLVDLYPFVFGTSTAAVTAAATAPLGGDKAAGEYTDFVFTQEARRSLLLSLGVPKWVVDGTKPPRHRRGGKG